jgi:hypothetical protein
VLREANQKKKITIGTHLEVKLKTLFAYIFLFLFFPQKMILGSETGDVFFKVLSEEQELWPGFKLNNTTFLFADQDITGKNIFYLKRPNLNPQRVQLPEKIKEEIISNSYGLIQVTPDMINSMAVPINERDDLGKSLYFYNLIPSLQNNPEHALQASELILQLIKKFNSVEAMTAFCSLEKKDFLK